MKEEWSSPETKQNPDANWFWLFPCVFTMLQKTTADGRFRDISLLQNSDKGLNLTKQLNHSKLTWFCHKFEDSLWLKIKSRMFILYFILIKFLFFGQHSPQNILEYILFFYCLFLSINFENVAKMVTKIQVERDLRWKRAKSVGNVIQSNNSFHHTV